MRAHLPQVNCGHPGGGVEPNSPLSRAPLLCKPSPGLAQSTRMSREGKQRILNRSPPTGLRESPELHVYACFVHSSIRLLNKAPMTRLPVGPQLQPRPQAPCSLQRFLQLLLLAQGPASGSGTLLGFDVQSLPKILPLQSFPPAPPITAYE